MDLKFAKWAGLLLLWLQVFYIMLVAFDPQRAIPVPEEDGIWPFLSFFTEGIVGTVILFVTEIVNAVRSRKQAGKNDKK